MMFSALLTVRFSLAYAVPRIRLLHKPGLRQEYTTQEVGGQTSCRVYPGPWRSARLGHSPPV
jgi:hypothetical protein